MGRRKKDPKAKGGGGERKEEGKLEQSRIVQPPGVKKSPRGVEWIGRGGRNEGISRGSEWGAARIFQWGRSKT